MRKVIIIAIAIIGALASVAAFSLSVYELKAFKKNAEQQEASIRND